LSTAEKTARVITDLEEIDLCLKILARYVNFAGVKVKNSISKVKDVSHRNVRLKDAHLHLDSMDVQPTEVDEVARVANPIICASCVPSNVLGVYMGFWNASSVVIMKLRFSDVV
jgi:hypothetical protein